jgi:hypothetical protein
VLCKTNKDSIQNQYNVIKDAYLETEKDTLSYQAKMSKEWLTEENGRKLKTAKIYGQQKILRTTE